MRKLTPGLLLLLAFLGGEASRGEGQEKQGKLPLPASKVVDLPPLPPTVITSGGQRLLLGRTDIEVRYDPGRKALIVNRPGCWVINYPLTRIRGLEGKAAGEISELLFGKPAGEVRNWYVKTPGSPGAEPPAPAGPAPIELTPEPTFVVNAQHPKADDQNAGTAEAPLKSISAAVARAKEGTVIHVHPGVYREVVKVAQKGTAQKPLRIEGVRSKAGDLPVICGNDRFSPDAWKSVEGLPGVYRADIFANLLGSVSVDNTALIERSLPGELKEGEYCFNHASKEFLNLGLEGKAAPREGEEASGKTWVRVGAGKDGFLDLGKAHGEAARNAVFWASAFLWVDPLRKKDVVWNPQFPEIITGRVLTKGTFRAFRITGLRLATQCNKYRVWVNGQRLPSTIYSTAEKHESRLPHPYRDGGFTDRWDGFKLNEGWNHILFQFDTTSKPDQTTFRFEAPKGIEQWVSSASPPADKAKSAGSAPRPYLSEALVLGPFPAEKDLGVYVRLLGNVNPNAVPMGLAARGGPLVSVEGEFVRVRGFEICHGAQFMQRSLVQLEKPGTLLEGCRVKDSEVGGVRFNASEGDQTTAPIVIRNNWIINSGNLGIAGSGTYKLLTPKNLNDPVPGRNRVLIEHNTIVNSNWAGYSTGNEAGGMKVFNLTGAVLRYNTVVAGSAQGIWLDWQHYGNRIEGNLFRNVQGYGVGVEASPGPNLLANNISFSLRPGGSWMRAGLLAWDSHRVWAVHNTIDGRWDPTPTWQNQKGTDGITLYIHTSVRGTRWEPWPVALQGAYVNNLVVGCPRAITPRKGDAVEANFTDKGKGAEGVEGSSPFVNPDREDYRLKPDSPLRQTGVENEYSKLVTHDFYGLLRFPDQKRTVGACRIDPKPKSSTDTLVEVEFQDGSMHRLYDIDP